MKKIKREIFYIKLAFSLYGIRRGFFFLWQRYIVAPRILKSKKSFEKPITNGDLSIHMLTGHQDFLIALWSLASYYSVAQSIGKLFYIMMEL